MIPSRQNTTEGERQIQFAVWMMERGIDLMGPGVECVHCFLFAPPAGCIVKFVADTGIIRTLVLLINFGDRAKNPSMSVARSVLNIIQSHYPERLGLGLIINVCTYSIASLSAVCIDLNICLINRSLQVPMLVNMFFKVIMPFVDPVTRNKVKFNPRIIEDGIFDKDQVMSEWWGGDREFQYEHSQYWSSLVNMTSERRKMQTQRWRELGGKVGISEWEMKTAWPSPPPPIVESEKIRDAVAESIVTPVQAEEA